LTLLLGIAAQARSAEQATHAPDVPLVKLALAKFHVLTPAERALLEFADISNLDRGQWATAGTSADPLDPSNDPGDADKWPHDRDVRAALLRWMCVDPEAVARIDPNGMRLIGARILGTLDLSRMRVPFALALVRCMFPRTILLSSAELPELDLTGSSVDRIEAGNLNVKGNLFMGWNSYYFCPLHARGEVYLSGAHVGGDAGFGSSHFQTSKAPLIDARAMPEAALTLQNAVIGGELYLCCGFESKGPVELSGATIKGNLDAFGAHFAAPAGVAIKALSVMIDGNVAFGLLDSVQPTKVDGLLDFTSASVGNNFLVRDTTFTGTAGSSYGLLAPQLSMHGGSFIWQKVELNGGSLDLTAATVGLMVDDEASWPAPGKLIINDFVYTDLAPPDDARSRLRWLALEPAFQPQPYRQLAQVLRNNGDDAGAIEVLVAQEDARVRNSNWPRQGWARFLKITIGYGHKPLRTVLWSLAVVVLGWLLVTLGARAGVMRATWPDSPPATEDVAYEKLHPLLYSLDVFLPFVNLHQEHYWWPDADRSGDCNLLGTKLRVSGAFLRYYLWTQVIAGWLLSAIFVAGVTGLMRND
jgi:hypothetical protein